MVDVALSLGRLLVALLLVGLNGFFVAAEFAFVRVRATSVEQLAEEGRAGAGALQDVMTDLDNYLATTQLGITLASLGLGWAGEPAIASLLEPVLGSLLPPTLVHLIAIGIGFSIITFLHVVFGELAPKTFAIAQTERFSLYLAPPMKLFYLLFYPGIVVFNGTANAFTHALGVPPASESDETLGEREIRRVLARSGEEGDVDVAEVAMIERVFELDDTVVREVMVPLPDVVSLPADASLAEVRSVVFEEEHTRYPVVEADDPTQVVGVLDVKDLLRAGEDPDADATTAGDLAREILVVPETTAISDLLLQFRSDRRQMAAVIDEWGAFEGLATVEDVVEAIVGDLRDRFDAAEGPSIRQRGDGGFDVDGSVRIAAVNDALDTEFAHEAVETVGGLVLSRLDRAPEPGDTVDLDGYVAEVTAVDGSRISTVRIDPEDGAAEGVESKRD
ncbi:hemolysin family protein [Halolamina salifodinae]|uniref:CBS domain containing-hemolysin-like protein n=1 Tax=Halolamina salifodinae TaxID=1202767 RepID=A0A8T4GXB4_9EURY|nr:hemolysin family protein [Halolamina salifodinae]MBP1987657.1 CBS domain containing-hemolysin-like protein [Halolamina salifodinae]